MAPGMSDLYSNEISYVFIIDYCAILVLQYALQMCLKQYDLGFVYLLIYICPVR